MKQFKVLKLKIMISTFLCLSTTVFGRCTCFVTPQYWGFNATALTYNTDTVPGAKAKTQIIEKFTYAELVVFHNLPGREAKKWVNCNNISDENWELIKKCKTNIEALDFMGELGWELIQIIPNQFDNKEQSHFSYYYLKKKILK